MPSSVYMYSAVLLHACCSLDLDCVIEVWSQLTPPGGGRGSRRKDFSSLEVCLWTVKWGPSFSFLSLCVCAHVCVWVCTCRGVHTQACVRRPEGNNRCLLQSASTLCLEAGSHWTWSSLTELDWLLSVLCSGTLMALLPQSFTLQVHTTICGFYRSAGDPNLGPYARMQMLQASKQRDQMIVHWNFLTRQEKTKPSPYILTCLRCFVVVVVMENWNTVVCQLYLSEGGDGGELEGLRPAHSGTVIKLCEKQRLHL